MFYFLAQIEYCIFQILAQMQYAPV